MTIRRAVSVKTVTIAACLHKARSTDACSTDGADRTVCNVTTIGTVNSLASVNTKSPASPPKIPNSCSINTTSTRDDNSSAAAA